MNAAASLPFAPTGLRLWWRMTRPGFLLITISACVLGMATAATHGSAFSWARALLTLLLACGAHAGANVLNDFHDARNGADAANTCGLFPFTGGSRLIQQGAVDESCTHRLAWTLLALVALGGLLLAAHAGQGLLLIGLAGLGLGWAYSAPPLKLMSRGLGELAVACAWWGLVVGADYVQRGQFACLPFALGLGLALLVSCILLINGVPDAPSDAQVGKRTLAVRLGAHGAAWLYLWLVLLAHGTLVLGWVLAITPAVALWALTSLPLSLTAAALLLRHAQQPAQLRPSMALGIAAANLHALAAATGLLLGMLA